MSCHAGGARAFREIQDLGKRSVIYMHLKKYGNLPRNSKVVFSRLVMSVRSLTLRSIKDNLTHFSEKIK